LRKEWSEKTGEPWPQGNQAIHILPLADGGADDGGSNILPQHPLDHADYNKNEGDFARWSKRRGRTCKQ
jgi:hypothetical protein